MAKAIRQVPKPVQDTFDLIGLTRAEMLGLHALIGGTHGDTAYILFQVIEDALREGHDADYSVRQEREDRFPGLTGNGGF